MCDIWKDNKNVKQLTEDDVRELLTSLKTFDTKQVLMSGGEALLNDQFFTLCKILKQINIKITLLSTGLLLKRHAQQLINHVDEVIISLDGTPEVHDRIRNIPGAFRKMADGINEIKKIKADFPVSARTVIHKFNYGFWIQIIETAKGLNLQSISFLPADVSSHAFNREVLWSNERQHEIMLSKDELPVLAEICDYIIQNYRHDFETHFISESPEKLRKIVAYYQALHGLSDFPFKKCNAPWVSTVIEADGSVRPCFFHGVFGNIHQQNLNQILNSDSMVNFRKNLNIDKDETCKKCVCYLNLPPQFNPVGK
jgi:MoaA/NifB/PqqE/SkfB family radical SAM enzyme